MEMGSDPASPGKDPAAEIAALALKLQETQQRLQELTGGEIDAVLNPGGHFYLLQEAQEKLRQSEAAQRGFAVMQSSILNALPAHIALIDHEGVILSINEGWRGFAQGNGIQSSACGVGQNYLEICDRAHGDCSEEAFRTSAGIRAVLAGTIREFEIEYPCHGPTEQRWFRLMVAPLGTNGTTGAAIMHINITERKLAQEKLRQSEERFRNMFTAAATGIAVSTPQGRYLYANAAYCRMLDYTEEELRERDFASLTHPDDLARNLKLRDELLAGQRESILLEKRYLKKNGDIVWTRHSVSATHTVNGEIATLMVVAEDITERKLAEQQILWKTALFEAMVHSSLDGITIVDRENRRVIQNQRIIDIWKMPPEVAESDDTGRRYSWIVTQIKDPEPFTEKGTFLLNHPDETGLDEVEFVDGRIFERHSSPVRGKDGTYYGRIWIMREITERKRAEEQLLGKTALFEAMVHSSLDGITIADAEGRIILQNQKTIDLWNIPPDLEGERDSQRRFDWIKTQVKNPGPFAEKGAHLFSHPDEIGLDEVEFLNEKIYERYSAPIRGKDGTYYGRIWAMRDITGRRMAEEELRQRQTELQALFDLMPAMVWFKDTTNGILRVNQRAANATGKPVEEIVGRSMLELYPQEAAKYYADDQEVIQSRAPKLGIVETLRGAEDRELWVQTDKVPVCDRDGKVTGIVVMVQDITERKMAEESLNLFRNLVDQSPDAIEVIDPETGRFLDINTTGCARLGYSREEMLALKVADIDIERDYRTLWPVVIEEIKKTGFAAILGRHRRKDGTSFPVEVNARYINLNRGYMVAVVRDITERKLAENQAAKQLELISIASRVGKLGAWAIEYPGPQIVWSEEVFRIHEVEPGFKPDLESALNFFPPASRKKLEAALQRGQPYDLELDFITAKGKKLCVRTTSQVEMENGVLIRYFGTFQDLTDRKQNEARVRRLVDSNVQGVFFWNTKGEIFEANDALLSLVGYTREDLKAGLVKWTTMTPPELTERDQRALRELAARGACEPYEKEYIRKDGTRVPVLIGPAMFDDNPDEGVCFVVDIRKRKAAENELRLSEERFSKAVEYAPIGMALVAPDGKFLTVNRALCDLVGYSFLELPSKTFQEITHPDDLLQDLEKFGQLLAGEIGFYAMEKRYIHKQGHFVWIHLSVSLVRDFANQPLYLIAQIQDITGNKIASDKIAEQAALINEASDAIVVRDLNHRVTFWSKGAERMFGWTSEEALGRLLPDLLKPDAAKFEEAVRILLETGTWNDEIPEQAKSEAVLSVYARWTLLRDAKGQPRSILAIETDITERKKLEQQFLRAQRMESIGTLAGGVAHDLNNILAPIMMSIEILKATSANAQARDILETIEVSAKRGADIVRQVLSFARGVEGERIEIQPNHLFKDLEHIIKDTFPKDVRLTFTIPKDTWTILGDPTQVHQIFLNLCVNARDAMPNGGSLTISVENCLFDEHYVAMNPQAKVGRYVKISVTDSGSGIPPAILNKIFDPFFTTKAVNKGTGLGLSTVMAIVKSHDGIINVYSEPGKGTTFKVYLPATEINSEGLSKQTQPISMPRGNGETVLVIDDEASILAITGKTLQAFGYRVLTATNGAEALAIYAQKQNEIAVVLTDMMMPVLDGPATIYALTKINPAIKIIAASGLAANGSGNKSPGHNIKHFLTKPYTAEALLTILRAILDEK